MTNNLMQLDLALPVQSIEAYVRRVQLLPMLSEAEELQFATTYAETGDLDAARQLVLGHLKFVVKIARGYLGYGLPFADLIQEGNIGLMKAVKRFNPNIGVRLVGFAVHWIKAEIHEYILRNWRIVKVATTKAQRKLFFNLRKMKQKLCWWTAEEVESVAAELGLSADNVREMENRLTAADVDLDIPAGYLEDDRYNPEVELVEKNTRGRLQDKLAKALQHLDSRSQAILNARWLSEDNKLTLEDLAAQYNVSAERIRRIEKNALNKLRQAVGDV